MRNAQAAQTAAAATASAVPDGLTIGGLQPSATPFQNATLQPQTVANGRTSVTIRQTAPASVLNWNSFNVGGHTTLTFDQSAGGANAATWAALNRITDPSGKPSQILGRIQAQGQVYVVNPNGILFGTGSQVNLHDLVASTASITDQQFLAGAGGSTVGGLYGSSGTPSFTGAKGSIIVQPGATITTDTPSNPTSAGGHVILLATNVTNQGTITTPNGQTILAGGTDFILEPGYSLSLGADGSVSGNATSTVRGSAVGPVGAGSATNGGIITASTGDVTLAANQVTQAGVTLATTSVNQRGSVHLLGNLKTSPQAATGYGLDPTAKVALAANAATLVLNDTSGATALASQLAPAPLNPSQCTASPSDCANAQYTTQLALGTLSPLQALYPRLPDTQSLSRIEISAGGSVDFQTGSLTMATGGQIATSAGVGTGLASTGLDNTGLANAGRIVLEPGATLDVAGSLAAVLPMSANDLNVQVQGFELRDDPLNRDTTKLNSATVSIDARTLISVPAATTSNTGTAAAGYSQTRAYTAGGLLEVSGELNNVGHTIDEFTASGGTVALAGSVVATKPGSVVNIAGGTVTYQAGALAQTWLTSADGRLHNANTAPATIAYTGIYAGQTFTQPRWNTSQTFRGALIAPASIDQPGYVVGRDAGTLTITAGTAALDGAVDAGVVTGPYQNAARAAGLASSFPQAQSAVPLGGALALGSVAYAQNTTSLAVAQETVPNATAVVIGADPGVDLGIDSAIDPALLGTTTIAAASLNAAQLGGLTIAATGAVSIAAPLTLSNGGSVSITAPATTIAANVTAHGGKLSVSDTRAKNAVDTGTDPVLAGNAALAALAQNEVLAAGVVIDTTGLWTNALLDPTAIAGEAYVDGGAVSFTSTRGIALGRDSLIDASSGGILGPKGTTTGGTGGAIAINADTYAGPNATAATYFAANPLTLGGTLRAIGGKAGGALSLTAPSIAIGDGLAPGVPAQLVLPTALFASGFASYTIAGTASDVSSAGGATPLLDARGNAVPGVSVAPGTRLALVEPSYQFTPSSRTAPTGTAPASALLDGLQPLYLPNLKTATLTQRPAASLTLQSDFTYGNLLTVNGGSVADLYHGGAISIGQGAAITADPGASVSVKAAGSITVGGMISAPGGTISLVNDDYQALGTTLRVLNFNPNEMILVEGGAVLDVAARAYAATDLSGRPFGTVPAGGAIRIGGPDVLTGQTTGRATGAFVVIEGGASLDASGASAMIDPAAGLGAGFAASLGEAAGARSLPSAGGTIALDSETGIILDGTLRAASGGTGAAGGTLSVAAETPAYNSYVNKNNATYLAFDLPDGLRVGRDIAIDAQYQPTGLSGLVAGADGAGDALSGLIGQTHLGTDQVAAGGFGTVSLATEDAISFDGSLTLTAGTRIALTAGAIGMRQDSGAANIVLAAPYVSVSGQGADGKPGEAIYSSALDYAAVVGPAPRFAGVDPGATYAPQSSGATDLGAPVTPSPVTPLAFLSVEAANIDFAGFPQFGQEGAVGLGGSSFVAPGGQRVSSTTVIQGGTPTGDGTGKTTRVTALVDFASIELASQGDIRFLAPPAGSPSATTTLLTSGNVTLRAQQIYPASGASAQVIAGAAFTRAPVNQTVPELVESPSGTIAILSETGSAAMPQTLGGSLTLIASTIDQGGTLRAPLGAIVLGSPLSSIQTPTTGLSLVSSPDPVSKALTLPLTSTIVLEPGSLTSVSANGLTIADGGTTDGTIYTGTDTTGAAYSSTSAGSSLIAASPGVTLAASAITETAGATLDLGGGGTISGIGFITGRGGSVDTLSTPALTLAAGGAQSGNAVYAIVAGPQPAVAQASLEGYAPPGLGQQVTIPSGIPGLPAGSYTLLPAENALRPGGYRIELTSAHAPRSPYASPSGSYTVDVGTGVAGTAIASAIPTLATITPAATVRDQSQYDEESYTQFVQSQASLGGLTRTVPIPADGGLLQLSFASPGGNSTPPPGSALAVDGNNRFAASADGYGGEVSVAGLRTGTTTGALEITPTRASAGAAGSVVAIDAPDIDAFGADVIAVAGKLGRTSGGPLSLVAANSAPNTVVDAGATLAATELVITAGGAVAVNGTLTTAGRSGSLLDSGGGDVFFVTNGPGALVLSSGYLATQSIIETILPVTVGPSATLVAGGTLLFDTSGAVSLPASARYGAADLELATRNLIIGSKDALAAAGSLPSGIVLNANTLAALLAGDATIGAPALQRLTATVSSAVDIYGSFDLVTTALKQIEFDTPSIQGFGAAGDTATLTAGTFVWNGIGGKTTGSVQAPLTGTGSGTLRIATQDIILGYGDGEVPIDQNVTLDRVLTGFSGVTLAAGEAIIGRDHGTLIAYQSGALAASQPASGTAYTGTGGNLTLDTPLLTTADGAVLGISAGGAVSLRNALSQAAGSGQVPASNLSGQGGEIDITAGSLALSTRVAAPAGKLSALATEGDITLDGAAAISLAGITTSLFDQSAASPGGSLVLESAKGSIVAAPGSMIDVSGQAADAGSVEATATQGAVALGGSLLGQSGGQSGGGAGARLTIRTGSLPQAGFDELQTALNEGGFTGGRSIEIGAGDIAVTGGAGAANQLRASQVSLSVDQGSLVVSGVIDASGTTPGSISLAAGGSLSVGPGAALDAHSTLLHTDSNGAPIDAENAPSIDLRLATASTGTLSIGDGAVLDVSSPELVAADGVAPGRVSIEVPRVLLAGCAAGPACETGGLPLRVGAIDVKGAGSVALYGFRAYGPTAVTDTATLADGTTQSVTTETVSQSDAALWDTDSQAFIAAALPGLRLNTGLASALGSLATSAALHLRPGVEVDVPAGAANPSGALTISNDIDLSSYRYASLEPRHALDASLAGSGEPGALVIRAAGSLTVNGSVTDGFATPGGGAGSALDPDNNGWVLTTASSSLLGTITLPVSAGTPTLGGSNTSTTNVTTFANTGALNYPIIVQQNVIKSGVVLPVDVTLGASLTVPAGTTASADIVDQSGAVVVAKGTTLTQAVTVAAGGTVRQGFVVPTSGITTLAQGSVMAPGAPITQSVSYSLPKSLANSAVSAAYYVVPASYTGVFLYATSPAANAVLFLGKAGTQLVVGRTYYFVLNGTYGSGKNKVTLPTRASYTLPFPLVQAPAAGQPAGQLWPSGASLAAFQNPVSLAASVQLIAGNVIPGGTTLYAPLVAGASTALPLSLPLRQTNASGAQGQIYAAAAPLAEGSLSWSIDLAAGANLAGAAPLGLQATSALAGGGNLVLDDPHVGLPTGGAVQPSFSVIRTGTGALSLAAAGSLSEDSLFGVYTAGAAVAGVPEASQIVSQAVETGLAAAGYASAATGAGAYRGVGGGDLTIAAQGGVSGYIYDPGTQAAAPTTSQVSSAIGNWLWWQGGPDLDEPASWGVNAGSYVQASPLAPYQLIGFTGFGTLGGGNVTITAGMDAGVVSVPTLGLTSSGTPAAVASTSGGLVIAAASGSYVDATGTRQTTGGGDVTLRVGGAINPAALAYYNEGNGSKAAFQALPDGLDGVVVDLRGNASIAAGAVGNLAGLAFGGTSTGIYTPAPTSLTSVIPNGGLTLVPGDSAISIQTRGDLSLVGAGDATRLPQLAAPGANAAALSWFSLWDAGTSVSLQSAGGNIATAGGPDTTQVGQTAKALNTAPGELPPTFRVTADAGSIFQPAGSAALVLAPSASGQLDLFAAGLIETAHLDISGGDPGLTATIDKPADYVPAGSGGVSLALTNAALARQSNGARQILDGGATLPLYAFGPDVATPALHADDNTPARIYAGGDIVSAVIGEQVSQTGQFYYPSGSSAAIADPTLTLAAKSVWVRAGGSIVALGTTTGPVLFLNDRATDVSIVQSGRDIVEANADVAGPGTLALFAGREFYQANQGTIESLGAIATGTLASGDGASIDAVVGTGAAGPANADFASLYLDPANLADPTVALQDQPGRVLVTYQDALLAFMRARGYTGAPSDALAAFGALDPALQSPFLLGVLFDELKASGQAASDPSSRFYKSYLRGETAIAALFPGDRGYHGDATLFGASGIKTVSGGTIELAVPGGQAEIGVASQPASASSGVLTQGSGDIGILSQGSVLLGQSRVFTTFGGGVTIWSESGDVNAGQGAKTTQVFTPPSITYDLLGDITLSPTAPATGAGIATLAPVQGVAPGDIVLVAPNGIIDAGEAGIRSTGNVALAALTVVNAANVQASGKTTGTAVPVVVNVAGALSAATAAGSNAAASAAATPGQAQSTSPSNFITVEVEIPNGGGGGSTTSAGTPDDKRKKKKP